MIFYVAMKKITLNLVFFRREYIDILNANTLSLDGMADINMALRGAISGNNWNKHGHVKWVVEQMAKLLQAITPTG